MRGKKHSDELRAQVMAALLSGQGVMEIAKEYDLDESTVRNWKRRVDPGLITGVNAKTEGDFDGLLDTYLRENLATLAVQARFFRNPEWLAKQPAAELGVLHGILTDKSIRLLGALQRGDGEPEGSAV